MNNCDCSHWVVWGLAGAAGISLAPLGPEIKWEDLPAQHEQAPWTRSVLLCQLLPKGQWSLSPASLNPSTVPWISTARDSLMQKKFCPWSFWSLHSEWMSVPLLYALFSLWQRNLGWSTATGPSQAADVTNNPPLGKWDPWHWCFAACQCARAWGGDEKTSWEQKKL